MPVLWTLVSYLWHIDLLGQSSGFHRCWSPHIHTCPGRTLRSALSGGLLVGNSKWSSRVCLVKIMPFTSRSQAKKKKKRTRLTSRTPTTAPFISSFALSLKASVVEQFEKSRNNTISNKLHKWNATLMCLLLLAQFFKVHPPPLSQPDPLSEVHGDCVVLL